MEDQLAALVAGELSELERDHLQAQLDRHPEWIAVLAALIDTPSLPPSADGPEDTLQEVRRAQRRRLAPGTRLGPYAVTEEIGRGGMGIVYAAHDARLRRTVALKVLTSDHGSDAAIAEARATARVRHPNVVQVFDAGEAHGRTFIAMERLLGDNLASWRASAPRSVTEVLAVFAAAGHGLAAAHAAGLVHRDFKPSNVIVTATGRVVVLDFGLAVAAETDATADARAGSHAAVGTLAYMAPEQRRGARCDARADQFAFAVALSESLSGALPAASLASRPATFPPATGRVPAAVSTALARARAQDPSARFVDMDALLATLTAPPRGRGWRWGLLALGLGSLAVWAGDDRCADAGAAIDSSYDRADARSLAARFADAPDARARLGRLDAFADTWADERTAVCRQSRADPGRAAGRLRCLEQARRTLEAVVGVLQAGDTDAQTLEALETLPDLARCRDPDRSDDIPTEGDEEIDAALAEAEALRVAGRVDAALERTAALADTASPADPARAGRIHLAHGLALRDAGRHADAEVALTAARDRAAAAHDDATVAEAYANLAWVVGYPLARHEEGRELLRHVDAWSDRLGRPASLEVHRLRTAGWIELDAGDPTAAVERFEAALAAGDATREATVAAEDRAMTLNGLGAAALTAGDTDRAIEGLRRAADTLARLRGDDHVSVAKSRNNLAAALRAQGRYAESIEVFDHNLAVFARAMGPDRLIVGQTLVNRAVARLDLGQFELARIDADAALTAFERSVGTDHPMVAKAHTLRGDARLQLGDPEGALADFAFALEHERTSLGEDHPSLGTVLTDMGSAYYELSRPAESIDHHRRALAILEKAWGDDHPDIAFVLVNLGLAQRLAGDDAGARTTYERALAIAGPQNLATARTRLAELLIDAGEIDEARRLLTRALADHATAEGDPVILASTWFGLARVTEDPQRADALAHAALQIFEQHDVTDGAARVRTWLRR
jgi:serine/threonine-protein kinase